MSKENIDKMAIVIENGIMSYDEVVALINNEWGEFLLDALIKSIK